MRRQALAGWLSLALLASCTVGEDFTPPKTDLPGSYSFITGATPQVRDGYRWWLDYKDPLLNDLIALGFKQNLDIRKALARIEQAQALGFGLGQPGSIFGKVEGKRDIGGGEDASGSGFARIESLWIVDLFGELRREREAAGYRIDTEYAEADVQRLFYLSQIATAYIDMRFYQELIRTNLKVLKSRERTFELTQELEARGEVSDLEVAQSRALVAQTKAELPEVEILLVGAIQRIFTLVAEPLQDFREKFDKQAPQPTAQFSGIRTGVPADLLRNRPDVRKAERRYAEAVALTGVAEADLYPSLTLTGNINLGYTDSGFDPIGSFFRGAVDIPVFDRGKRRARLAYQKARADELRLEWERVVLVGVEEVQRALIGLSKHTEAVAASEEAVVAAADVLSIARKAYAARKINFLQVLDAERAFLSAQNARALDKRNLAVDYVNLNVALGGAALREDEKR
ncbi:efflux transporter outer membrane subunit [Pseudoruegeria sp. SHC-113]|uniref:efflux transporter outer membrane subunit n=1 Tax=Pseudoruegeria sp. SHC-113 TaxID=2855439 RepID=UPI0021BA66A9|nr:efflux transporter outer membrane subunit [Pseudoruegeria sp. SHC-113]MCT8158851.1 efflux transporter outer membrane subunit [Pseudoruegeria sp. SHC-113]